MSPTVRLDTEDDQLTSVRSEVPVKLDDLQLIMEWKWLFQRLARTENFAVIKPLVPSTVAGENEQAYIGWPWFSTEPGR